LSWFFFYLYNLFNEKNLLILFQQKCERFFELNLSLGKQTARTTFSNEEKSSKFLRWIINKFLSPSEHYSRSYSILYQKKLSWRILFKVEPFWNTSTWFWSFIKYPTISHFRFQVSSFSDPEFFVMSLIKFNFEKTSI